MADTRDCALCVFHTVDPGDWDVGIDPSIECTCEAVDPEVLETVEDVKARPGYCGHFTPRMAEYCGHCKAPINRPHHEVAHWAVTHFYADEPEPMCSQACAEAANRKVQELWEEDQRQEAEFAARFADAPAAPCPHGEHPGECAACLAYGDFRADAAREARVFGR